MPPRGGWLDPAPAAAAVAAGPRLAVSTLAVAAARSRVAVAVAARVQVTRRCGDVVARQAAEAFGGVALLHPAAAGSPPAYPPALFKQVVRWGRGGLVA
jgi:hypothetical protein